MRFNPALLIAALTLLPCAAPAQPYPAKQVRVVVPYSPGSTPDIVGRTLSGKLQEALGQPFVVENRTGAGGNIGAEAVAKAPADGYTLLIGINGPAAINKFLYRNLSYDSDRDLVPVSLLASAPQMLVVTPAVGVDDFAEFIRHARAHPGRLSYASVGAGGAGHLTMELLKSDARLFLVHIPYRGFPPAVTDMLAGNIDTMFAIVPSVAELGYPQLESLAWIGLLATAGTPQEILGRLSVETVKAMQAADVRASLGKQGFDVVASSPAEFSKWIRAEQDKWGRIIRATGATVD